MMRALLLDLDDTLIVEEPAAVASFAATARVAAERQPLDPRQLALDARACARELWHGASAARSAGASDQLVGGACCRYEGDDDELRALREWAPGFRRDAWRAALGARGSRTTSWRPSSASASARSAARATRPSRTPPPRSTRCAATTASRSSPTAPRACSARSSRPRGSPIASTRSSSPGELRSAKPDPAVYAHALDALGAEPADAVMVGDSLRNDVDGPLAAGLGAVWVNRTGEPRPADRPDLVEIADLRRAARRTGLGGGPHRRGPPPAP